jgi:hypothetical protein
VNVLIEDGLTRMAIMLEVNSHYGIGVAQDYERLLAAAVARGALKDALAAGLEDTQQALIDEAIARAGPGASSAYFTMGVEETGASEIGAVLDALLAVGAISAEDVQSFLRQRIRRVAAYWAAPGVIADDPALVAHFDGVCSDLPGDVAWRLLGSLHHAGLLSTPEFERRFDTARDADSTPGVGEVRVAGRPLESLLGPADRRCGVRVLAVECCEDGVVIHAHRARREVDERGRYTALPDEVLGEAAAEWPAIPRLTLHDDAGSAYRGEIPPDRPVEILQDDGIDEIAAYVFTPAVPRGAVALWLASRDASVRIRLR